ncbi:MAG TPA: hypothetical protein VGD67_11525 [Pseudonocardiaceae bacterium]
MWWKVLGALALVWVAFMVVGAVVKALTWVLVIGAVVLGGVVVANAVMGRGDRRELR